ncbi:MAG: TlpA disulfide reductase family protein, partial [Lysobacterales bacterium]
MRCVKLIGLLVALTLTTGAQAQVRLQAGDAAPDSLGTDRDGKQVRIADYHGKVVVLTFWATWCGYCLKELPILENLQRRLGKARIEVVAINTDKNRVDYIR